jgi:hypothetical protein
MAKMRRVGPRYINLDTVTCVERHDHAPGQVWVYFAAALDDGSSDFVIVEGPDGDNLLLWLEMNSIDVDPGAGEEHTAPRLSREDMIRDGLPF